jgi:hypothetical protein
VRIASARWPYDGWKAKHNKEVSDEKKAAYKIEHAKHGF